MKITFISHAGFLLECKGYKILCDPWLKGKVFNNGWALISPPAEVPFEEVDYIWISHEHPDHFNLPTLKGIPETEKKRIQILHQRHASPRLYDTFKQLGFEKVIELPLYRWLGIVPGVEICCGSVGSMDSFLAIRDGEECVLNLNDCVLNNSQIHYLKGIIGRISVLFTQFSFANWVGNKSDEIGGAEAKIQQLKDQIGILEPEFTVPFASFVYFCNRENSRMNDWVNTPERIRNMNLPGVHFMYPGDRWDSGIRSFESVKAVERYMEDMKHISIDPTPESVELAKIKEGIEVCLDRNKKRFSKRTLRKINPFDIYVHDLDKIITIYPGDCSYRIVDANPGSSLKTRYVMCSQVVWYAFAHTWGFSTVEISGMFLDRLYKTQGRNPFFFYQNILSTKVLDLENPKQVLRRTVPFFWNKKWELFYRYSGGAMPDAD